MENFIGYERIIDSFKIRAKKNTLSHAHIIVGPDGIGKSILAKIFAVNILNKPEMRDYIDIINYRLKKASFGIDEIREVISEINKRPYEGDKKVVIIHNGDKMTVQAQNAFLKTIEEPPQGVYIIILTESLELMLDTIKSRSQLYKLTPLSNGEIEKYLSKIGKRHDEKYSVAIAYSGGIPGRAERIFDDDKLIEARNIIIDIFKSTAKRDLKILNYESNLVSLKIDKQEIINIMALFIRDIIVYKELNNKQKIINIDKYEEIDVLSSLLSYKKLESMLKYIDKARINIKNNISYPIIINMLLIGFLED